MTEEEKGHLEIEDREPTLLHGSEADQSEE